MANRGAGLFRIYIFFRSKLENSRSTFLGGRDLEDTLQIKVELLAPRQLQQVSLPKSDPPYGNWGWGSLFASEIDRFQRF